MFLHMELWDNWIWKDQKDGFVSNVITKRIMNIWKIVMIVNMLEMINVRQK